MDGPDQGLQLGAPPPVEGPWAGAAVPVDESSVGNILATLSDQQKAALRFIVTDQQKRANATITLAGNRAEAAEARLREVLGAQEQRVPSGPAVPAVPEELVAQFVARQAQNDTRRAEQPAEIVHPRAMQLTAEMEARVAEIANSVAISLIRGHMSQNVTGTAATSTPQQFIAPPAAASYGYPTAGASPPPFYDPRVQPYPGPWRR